MPEAAYKKQDLKTKNSNKTLESKTEIIKWLKGQHGENS